MHPGVLRFVRYPVVLAFFSLLLALSVSALGNGLNGDCIWRPMVGECDNCIHCVWARTAVAAVLVILAMSVLWVAARDLLTMHHLRPSTKPLPHKVLIAAVSWLSKPLLITRDGKLAIPWDDGRNICELTGDLGTDIESITQAHAKGAWRGPYPWNGQQFLRAIACHAGILEQVILLGSTGADGSHTQLRDYERLVHLYAPKPAQKPNVDISQPPVEFEDLHAMEDAFAQCIRVIMRKPYTEDDIILDVTGGQKTASIAAALATLSRHKLEFQYVRTGGDNSVLAFNVVAEARPKPGGIG